MQGMGPTDPVIDEDRASWEWEVVDAPWEYMDVLLVGPQHLVLSLGDRAILHAVQGVGVTTGIIDDKSVRLGYRWKLSDLGAE
jgi:hypothetical protein